MIPTHSGQWSFQQPLPNKDIAGLMCYSERTLSESTCRVVTSIPYLAPLLSIASVLRYEGLNEGTLRAHSGQGQAHSGNDAYELTAVCHTLTLSRT